MGQTVEELLQQDLKEAKLVISLSDKNEEGAHCRFCWGSESSDEDPCIVPCKCSGTVGFIHLLCLRNWLSTKLQRKDTDNLVSLFWKTFECEICKQAYPYLFKTKENKVFKLVDIQLPKACLDQSDSSRYYLVLESLPLERNSSRTIHVLGFSPDKLSFNMGRGHESEVRVNDISVTRCHATIKYQPDGLYIEDKKSKFGTLVLLKERYYLQP